VRDNNVYLDETADDIEPPLPEKEKSANEALDLKTPPSQEDFQSEPTSSSVKRIHASSVVTEPILSRSREARHQDVPQPPFTNVNMPRDVPLSALARLQQKAHERRHVTDYPLTDRDTTQKDKTSETNENVPLDRITIPIPLEKLERLLEAQKLKRKTKNRNDGKTDSSSHGDIPIISLDIVPITPTLDSSKDLDHSANSKPADKGRNREEISVDSFRKKMATGIKRVSKFNDEELIVRPKITGGDDETLREGQPVTFNKRPTREPQSTKKTSGATYENCAPFAKSPQRPTQSSTWTSFTGEAPKKISPPRPVLRMPRKPLCSLRRLQKQRSEAGTLNIKRISNSPRPKGKRLLKKGHYRQQTRSS
jgi:hypothetical protein